MLQRHEVAKHGSGFEPLRQNEKLVWLTLFIVELLFNTIINLSAIA